MGRCPKYLNVDNFNMLASAMGISLTDDGASAIGEIMEHLAVQILRAASANNRVQSLDFTAILNSAKTLGIQLDVDKETKTVKNASL